MKLKIPFFEKAKEYTLKQSLIGTYVGWNVFLFAWTGIDNSVSDLNYEITPKIKQMRYDHQINEYTNKSLIYQFLNPGQLTGLIFQKKVLYEIGKHFIDGGLEKNLDENTDVKSV